MRVRTLVGAVVLVLIVAGCSSGSSKAAPTAAASGTLGIAGLNPTGSIGVVATGTGKQDVPADLAFVVISEGSKSGTSFGGITIGPNGSIVTTPTTAAEVASDHDAIRAALRPLGIAADAVDFSVTDPSGLLGNGGETLQIEVPVAKLPQVATAVVAAVKHAGVTVGSSGMRFAVRDCTAALSTARDQAVADAHKRAQEIAAAAGVKLGALMSASESEQAGVSSYLSAGASAPCGRSSVSDLSSLQTGLTNSLVAMGAKPSVELSDSVAATYALGATASRTISAVGTGTASGAADAADILVEPQPGSGVASTPTALPQAPVVDAGRVYAALSALGVDRSQVEVENPPVVSQFSASSSAYVRVHVTVPVLRSKGAKIVAAVEAVVGSASIAGVVFSSSTCAALAARARADAVHDADARLVKLAASAKAKPGAVVGVAETGSIVLGPPLDTCHPDFSSISGVAAVDQVISSSGGSGSLTLRPLDADPQVTEQASLSITKAMTS